MFIVKNATWHYLRPEMDVLTVSSVFQTIHTTATVVPFHQSISYAPTIIDKYTPTKLVPGTYLTLLDAGVNFGFFSRLGGLLCLYFGPVCTQGYNILLLL